MRRHGDPLNPEGTRRRRRAAGLAGLAALALAGCGGDDDAGGQSAADGSASAAGTIDVIVAFYPLQFVAERVGGEHVAVTNLTPRGAEPHDLELSPRDTAQLEQADLVVYLAGFSPAIDDAVAGVDGGHAFDVTSAAHLDGDGEEHAEEAGEHAEDEGEQGDEHDHGGGDPHFWLDPTRLADVADAVAARLGELSPQHAADLTANAAALRAELEALDAEFESGLADCGSTEIVTSHTAFAYLAERYGLTQVGIAGLAPHEEPSPAELAEITDFVRDHGVSTIYYETLVDPAIADTVAAETGATTAVLDPIEGLSDTSAGSDYFEVMRANLATLRTGQACS